MSGHQWKIENTAGLYFSFLASDGRTLPTEPQLFCTLRFGVTALRLYFITKCMNTYFNITVKQDASNFGDIAKMKESSLTYLLNVRIEGLARHHISKAFRAAPCGTP